MKRIIIGRGNDCDIVIPDELDNVSRHHAVISVDFFGRMTLSDTSSNGTLINGTRMLKGASIPVTRDDQIQLGGAWIFDWNLVEDPYQRSRQICYVAAIVLFLFAIGLTAWSVYNSRKASDTGLIVAPKAPVSTSENEWNKDSTKNVAPTVVSITTPKTQKVKRKHHKHKKTATKRVTNNKERKNSDKEAYEVPIKKDYSTEKDMPAIN